MSDLFGDNQDEAKKARDAALSRVASNSGAWRANALAALSLLDRGYTGTAEDIRIRLGMKGLKAPHHHNAWGELIKTAIKVGKIVPTGQRRHMKTTKSHARQTPVYRVV